MSWQRYERAAEKGPGCLIALCGLTVFGLCLLFGFLFGVANYVRGWFSEAGQVARDEFGPKAMLRKYEEFKDQAAALEAKRASIDVAAGRLFDMERDRKTWERADKEQYYLSLNEVSGMKTSFNALAAQYNANMAKVNYRFANVGELPPGAKDPLPREFKEYLVK